MEYILFIYFLIGLGVGSTEMSKPTSPNWVGVKLFFIFAYVFIWPMLIGVIVSKASDFRKG